MNNYYAQPQGIDGDSINVYYPKQTVTTDKQGNITQQTLATSATDQVTAQGIANQPVPVTNIPASGPNAVSGTVVPCPGGKSTCFAQYEPVVNYGAGASDAGVGTTSV
ncbi:MAG TPA: hypothetical protein VKQ36_13400, partial [Ktedonobacterales bacterium]|nr:hypothetical protein [Ktedonobacterales bacterium]